MGYTHYYYVSPEFDAEKFARVAKDFKKMMAPLNHLGIVLADEWGENYPIVSPTEIRFNGLNKCGHIKRDLGITWPTKSASGVAKNGIGQQLEELTSSNWFAGAQLKTRVCGGDCSHESFCLLQKLSDSIWKQDDLKVGESIFQCTKTAYKPYDLAVNICLIIAKEHLGETIRIKSDGILEHWQEAIHLCQHFLEYGQDFELDEGDI